MNRPVNLPTVLGKVVLVDGCTVLPSVDALRALPAEGDRYDEIVAALESANRYKDALYNLRAETILDLKGKGWKLVKIARKFRLRYISGVNQMLDQRALARAVDADRGAA